MNANQATAIILTRMALQDGQLLASERAFIEEISQRVALPFEEIVKAAREAQLSALLPHLDRYEDRFFIALHACMLAHIDQHLDAREEAYFDTLVKTLEILPEDRTMIEEASKTAHLSPPPEPPARIVELYQASSLFEG